jgi:hypothetical protein
MCWSWKRNLSCSYKDGNQMPSDRNRPSACHVPFPIPIPPTDRPAGPAKLRK